MYSIIFVNKNYILKELIAYGCGNILCSLFQGFPSCVALSRCAILESVGGKTQVIKIGGIICQI
jgi:MFS superfamily sulfate permease-like transporter